MTRKLYILRGIPGSGKSTKAKELQEHYRSMGLTCRIRSTDEQFVNKITGQYDFDPKKLGWAHNQNQMLVERDMHQERDVIIVDNTNIKKRDYARYLAFAAQYGYDVEYCIVGDYSDRSNIEKYWKRNTHGVPIEAVTRMFDAFEY